MDNYEKAEASITRALEFLKQVHRLGEYEFKDASGRFRPKATSFFTAVDYITLFRGALAYPVNYAWKEKYERMVADGTVQDIRPAPPEFDGFEFVSDVKPNALVWKDSGATHWLTDGKAKRGDKPVPITWGSRIEIVISEGAWGWVYKEKKPTKMSQAEWRRRFYPIDAIEAAQGSVLDCAEHSLQKWKGALPENEPEGGIPIDFDASNCALCVKFRKRAHEKPDCNSCPLNKYTIGCAKLSRITFFPPWGVWTDSGNPIPMIAALEKVVEDLKGGSKWDTGTKTEDD